MTVTIRNLWAYLCVAGTTMAGGCLLYYAMPSRRYHLVMEDQLVETMTALVFFATFLGAVDLVRRAGFGQRKFASLLAVAGLLGFLDEMSFGQRLLQFRGIPVGGVRVDGFHDLFEVIRELLVRSPIARGVSVSVAAALALVFLGIRTRVNGWLGRLFQAGRENLAIWFVGVFVLLAAGATVLDLDLLEFGCATLVEEILEMNAAIALLCSCLCLRDRASSSRTGIHHAAAHAKEAPAVVLERRTTIGNVAAAQRIGRGD